MATPCSAGEGRGLVTSVTVARSTGICIAQALRLHNYLERLPKQLLVVSQLIYTSAGQQTAVTEVTRPLPSLAERGVAMRDYDHMRY